MFPVGIGARRQGATHRVRVASLKSIVERFVYFRRHLIVSGIRRARPRPSLKLKIIEQFELSPVQSWPEESLSFACGLD